MRKSITSFFRLSAVLSLSAVLVLASCEKSRVFERNLPVDENGWTYEAVQRFEVEVSDTTTPHNLFINIRHSDRFAWSNIWLRMTTIYPGGEAFERQMDLPMAQPDGRWLGICSGDICFRQQLIQAGVIFPNSGTYTFELQQDMRMDTLAGILDVGMRIEQVQGMAAAAGQER